MSYFHGVGGLLPWGHKAATLQVQSCSFCPVGHLLTGRLAWMGPSVPNALWTLTPLYIPEPALCSRAGRPGAQQGGRALFWFPCVWLYSFLPSGSRARSPGVAGEKVTFLKQNFWNPQSKPT